MMLPTVQSQKQELQHTCIEASRLEVHPACLSYVLLMTRFSASTQSAKPSAERAVPAAFRSE